MLCIVFMEISGGQLTKYISGGKNPFSTGCLMDGWTTSFIFLILTLAAVQHNKCLKNTMQGRPTMHLMQWQPHGTTDEWAYS